MKVRALPTCRKPEGDGANRTRSMAFEYSGIGTWPLAPVETGLARPRQLGTAETRQAASLREIRVVTGNRSGYRWVTKVTLPANIALASPHPIRRYFWKRRAQGGTCRKTPIVSVCLV